MGSRVKINCLCGNNQEWLNLTATIPVDASSCSCSICRHTTGVLWFSCLSTTAKPALVQKLQRYDSTDRLSRYFCGICGSHMLVHVHKGDLWDVCSGVVDRVVGHEQVFSLQHPVQHEFTSETSDGGLTFCLANFKGKSVPIYLEGPDQEPIEADRVQRSPQTLHLGKPSPPFAPGDQVPEETSENDRLHAKCHCGGVAFYITRPDHKSTLCSSPWPDLLAPYHSSKSSNPADVKWWLQSNNTKYLAGTCACRSCRLASGSPIQTWAFIPKANLLRSDGSTFDFDFGALRQFTSSPGCYRNFCGTCGATIFWHCEERPDLIDVSVGILRAPEGSRAETWLEWCTERVSFREEAFDHDLIDHLEKGLQKLR